MKIVLEMEVSDKACGELVKSVLESDMDDVDKEFIVGCKFVQTLRCTKIKTCLVPFWKKKECIDAFNEKLHELIDGFISPESDEEEGVSD